MPPPTPICAVRMNYQNKNGIITKIMSNETQVIESPSWKAI